MRLTIFILCVLLNGGLRSEERHVVFDNPGSPGSTWKWRPVALTEAEKALLEQRSDPPRTALDFYLLLGRGYFKNVDNGTERRITFIEKESLSDTYLRAEYTIPSTDAGAFWVTVKILGRDENKLIAISHLEGSHKLYVAKENGPQGLWSVSMNRPEFWRYRGGAFSEGGAWHRVSDTILPDLSVERILDRYRNHYKAHLHHADQKKSIYLMYELPVKGGLVQVAGRENFMSPRERYVWAEYVFDGEKFDLSKEKE